MIITYNHHQRYHQAIPIKSLGWLMEKSWKIYRHPTVLSTLGWYTCVGGSPLGASPTAPTMISKQHRLGRDPTYTGNGSVVSGGSRH